MRGSGERLHGMQEVTGSIPVISTKKSTVLRRKYGAFLFADAAAAVDFLIPKKDTLAFDRNLMQGCPYLNAKVS